MGFVRLWVCFGVSCGHLISGRWSESFARFVGAGFTVGSLQGWVPRSGSGGRSLDLGLKAVNGMYLVSRKVKGGHRIFWTSSAVQALLKPDVTCFLTLSSWIQCRLLFLLRPAEAGAAANSQGHRCSLTRRH